MLVRKKVIEIYFLPDIQNFKLSLP